MKKTRLLILLFAFILLLTGCGEKTAITAVKFSTDMEALDYVISDEKEEMIEKSSSDEDASHYVDVIVACEKDHIINYYEEEDEDNILYDFDEETEESTEEVEEETEPKIIRSERDPKYQIEFYVFDTEESAIAFYNYNKTVFEGEKTSTSVSSEESKKNYSKYLLDTGSGYKAISRIDNTLIYFDVAEDFKTTANSILTKFGY